MAIEKKLYTADEFEQFAEADSDRLLELIDGEIYEKMPTEEHGMVAGNIHAPLWNFVKPRKLGRVGIEVRHRRPEDQRYSLLPDVSFTSAERLLPIVEKGSVPQMPDLVVEVKSPDDTYKDLRAKADYYLANGSRLVWLVYPQRLEVEVCVKDQNGTVHRHTVKDVLDGGDVLPGFRLPLAEVFDLT
jgi:Uma2 family endonuclease